MAATRPDQPANLTANRLLASLPTDDLAQLARSLKPIALEQGEVLHHPGERVEHVYFPASGMVSHAIVMKDGRTVETATIGREGAIGALAGLGSYRPYTRAMTQLPIKGWRIPARSFRAVVQNNDALQGAILRAADNALTQAQITAACNAHHTLEQRLSRWILQARDRSEDETVRLTQELLSQALGVTRSSVSEAASRLQAHGTIRYSRGAIEVADRAALEHAACECYAAIAQRLQG